MPPPCPTQSPSRTPTPSPTIVGSPAPTAVVGPGTSCTTPLLGDAQDFGAFLLGQRDVALTVDADNARFGGRVAINGSAQLSNFEIGLQLNCTSGANANFSLIVSGDLNATNGMLTCGTYIAGGRVANPPELSAAAPEGIAGADVLARTGIDFAAATADLQSVSLALCASPNATAATVSPFGLIELTQTDLHFVSGVNGRPVALATIFSVRASDLATANRIVISLASGADPNATLLVINVLGAASGFNLTNAVISLPQGFPASNLLWNVCESGAVGLTNIQFLGSLLAPFSRLRLGNAQVQGTIVAATLGGAGFEQLQAPFNGFFCPA